MPTVMLDHPGWFHAPDGRTHRVVTDDTHKLSLVTADHLAQGLFIDCSPVGPVGTRTVVGYFDPGELCGPLTLTAPLRALGTVSRLANPWLWDALGTAILGQFATPKQVRHLYTRLCHAYGRLVRTHVGEMALFPRPEVLVGLGLEDFIDLQPGVTISLGVVPHGPVHMPGNNSWSVACESRVIKPDWPTLMLWTRLARVSHPPPTGSR